MSFGVIGNTRGFGFRILGSNPRGTLSGGVMVTRLSLEQDSPGSNPGRIKRYAMDNTDSQVDIDAEKAPYYVKRAIEAIKDKHNKFYDIIRRNCIGAIESESHRVFRRHVYDALKFAELGHKQGEIDSNELMHNLNDALKYCPPQKNIRSEGKSTSPQRRLCEAGPPSGERDPYRQVISLQKELYSLKKAIRHEVNEVIIYLDDEKVAAEDIRGALRRARNIKNLVALKPI